MSIEDTAREFIDVIDRLCVLMREETSLLQARRVAEIAPLQDTKAALGRVYASLFAQLRDGRAHLAGLAPDVRTALREKAQAFQELTVENRDWLQAAQHINQRVIEAVAEAVVEAESTVNSYGENGRICRETGDSASSISFNQLA